MARARAVSGLAADDTFAEAARKVVAVRAAEVFEHSRGVLDTSDIGPVHDMRVATRRLRAALEIFAQCLPKQELTQVLREVRAVADALGERRDPDVHIAALEELMATAAPADRPGVETLVARLRSQQELGNRRLRAALREMRSTDLQGRLQALVEAPA